MDILGLKTMSDRITQPRICIQDLSLESYVIMGKLPLLSLSFPICKVEINYLCPNVGKGLMRAQ